MTISFKDIMQKFYDDEKLGIKKEDAPVNATGVAVAGTGDDSSTVVVKKKKKNPYDGRTKEAKAFLKRMTERQSKLKEAVELDEFNKMTVTVNDPKQRKKVFDDLIIKSIKCKNSEFDDDPEIIAYIQVIDQSISTNDEVFVFNGWMFSSSPSINPFDHPVYDIWLTRCY